MLLQDRQTLRTAITHAKSSIHATALAEDIRQAESLMNQIK